MLLSLLILSASGQADDAVENAIEQFQEYFNNENAHVRRAAVMDLAHVDHPDVVEWLLEALQDPAKEVRAEAAKALHRQTTGKAQTDLIRHLLKEKRVETQVAILDSFKSTRPPAALDPVLKLAAHRTFELRLIATEVLGFLPESRDRILDRLRTNAEDSEPLVRLATFAALGQRQAKQLGELCLKHLLEDPDWRVRAACIQTLEQLRLRESIPPLIRALQEEEGRLQDDCHQALQRITGERDRLPTWQDWNQWWERVQDGFQVPTLAQLQELERRYQASQQRYQSSGPKYHEHFGVATRSQQVLFLLDISTSMADKLPVESASPARLAAFRERYGEYDTKIELAREEMINTIAQFPSHVAFNIVTFETEVAQWKKKPVRASSGNKNQAIKYLSRLTPATLLQSRQADSGRTNTFDALQLAFGLEETRQVPEKNHVIESDTVFLVTDGLPTAGAVTDPQQLLNHFFEVNQRARIVFHVITFDQGLSTLLRPIAERSGGQYVLVNP